jgi:hypothetical protein
LLAVTAAAAPTAVGTIQAADATLSDDLAAATKTTRASFAYYLDGGKITDAPAVINRLHTLIGQMTQKIQLRFTALS